MSTDVRRPPAGPPLVFVDELTAPALIAADAHHLGRVLRVRAGAVLTVADGAGAWCTATYDGVAGVEPVAPVIREPAPEPAITIAFALTKGDKPELVVQKLTELGADRIVAFRAARSVVHWDDAKAARHVARWCAVAREAAMQCRRARLPVVEPVTTFADVASRAGAVLAAPDGAAPSLARAVVLIGPEGGWAAEEEHAALARMALGNYVLRAETAAIAACSVLAALRSGLAGDMSQAAGS